MNEAIAQCPIISEVEAPSRQSAQCVSQPAAVAKAESPAAIYTAKALILVSGSAMMYFMINHGQVFKNYLQW